MLSGPMLLISLLRVTMWNNLINKSRICTLIDGSFKMLFFNSSSCLLRSDLTVHSIHMHRCTHARTHAHVVSSSLISKTRHLQINEENPQKRERENERTYTQSQGTRHIASLERSALEALSNRTRSCRQPCSPARHGRSPSSKKDSRRRCREPLSSRRVCLLLPTIETILSLPSLFVFVFQSRTSRWK